MSALAPFDRLVQKYMSLHGFDLVIKRRVADLEYNTDTSSFEEQYEFIPVRGMLWDLTLQSNGSQNQRNTLIEAGDKQLFIQPPSKNPEYSYDVSSINPNTDTVEINGDTYKIVTFKEYNPSIKDCVLWECYIRK